MNRVRRGGWACGLMAALLMLVACGQGDYEEYGAPTDLELRELRVVTLAPALTKMIVDLGQSRVLVGVGENDAVAPSNLPIVGNQWNIDAEKLIATGPTHVLMQVGKDGPSSRLQELARNNGFEIITYPYPLKLTQVRDTLFEDVQMLGDNLSPLTMETTNGELPLIDLDALQAGGTGNALGSLLGVHVRAQTLWWDMLTRMSKVETATRLAMDDPRPRVLLVIGVHGTVMASGPGSVNDELLSQFLNAQNAAADSNASNPTYDREAMLAMNPDVILLLMPNAPALGAIDEDERLSFFRGLDIAARRHNRIALLNDPLILLPSTNLDQTVIQMAKAIHPERAAAIDEAIDAMSRQSTPTLLPGLDEAPATMPDDTLEPATLD